MELYNMKTQQEIETKVLEAIADYKKEYELENITDMFETWRDIACKLDEHDVRVSFTPVQQDSDSFVMATYYIAKINLTIVLDWNVECRFENEKELIDEIVHLEMEGEELREKLTLLAPLSKDIPW